MYIPVYIYIYIYICMHTYIICVCMYVGDCDDTIINDATVIGAIVGVMFIIIIIMVITNIMVWIYCFRRRDYTGITMDCNIIIITIDGL